MHDLSTDRAAAAAVLEPRSARAAPGQGQRVFTTPTTRRWGGIWHLPQAVPVLPDKDLAADASRRLRIFLRVSFIFRSRNYRYSYRTFRMQYMYGADLGTVPDVTVPYSTSTVRYRLAPYTFTITRGYRMVHNRTVRWLQRIYKDRSVRLCYCSTSPRSNSVNDLQKK